MNRGYRFYYTSDYRKWWGDIQYLVNKINEGLSFLCAVWSLHYLSPFMGVLGGKEVSKTSKPKAINRLV